MTDLKYSAEVERRFSDYIENSPEKFERIIAYANRKVEQYLKDMETKNPINGTDVFFMIMDKTINGERYWDYKKVDIHPYLWNCIRSIGSKEAIKTYNELNKYGLESTDQEYETQEGSTTKSESKYDDPGINETDIRDFIEIVREELKDDKISLDIMGVWGMEKTERTHENLGYTKAEIEAAKKKIKRVSKRVMKELGIELKDLGLITRHQRKTEVEIQREKHLSPD